MRKEVPMWVAVVVIVVVLLGVGLIYWWTAKPQGAPPQGGAPPMPGVPVTARGASPIPATAQPMEGKSAPPTSNPIR